MEFEIAFDQGEVGSRLVDLPQHLPQDRWPYAVDTDAVTRVAAAAAALVVKLTR